MQLDVASVQAQTEDEPWLGTGGDTQLVRAMPAVRPEYRYPSSRYRAGARRPSSQSLRSSSARTNPIGQLPNEDAQSLIFDDTNLFEINKYSGYDRVEGGGRANVGIQYTANFNDGGQINALFGQSYQLFGTNSYANYDMANTGRNPALRTTPPTMWRGSITSRRIASRSSIGSVSQYRLVG